MAGSGLDGAVTEPTRRSRTPLTPHQIDAIQTARDSGESVMSIARRFEVSRMTVWKKTRTR
ncbi:helix-turn-helix domain-containing protein [Brooklawnia cerclae]|uniref:helix-turn-helix domain-containing protein n=1 Tax=Brooklawnia cerclae TaxID=349934 RepID=UPI003C7C9631